MVLWEGSHLPNLRQVLRWILGILQHTKNSMSNEILCSLKLNAS